MLSSARASLRGPLVLSILLIAAFTAACGAAASAPGAGAPAPGQPAGGGTDSGNGGPTGGGDPGTGGGNQGGGSQGGGDGKVVYLAEQPGLLIIKTGAIAIQVEGIDAAVAAADQLIAGVGGYTAGSDRSGDEESDQASITYRIPAQRWDESLGALRKLGIKVLNERSSTEDVTSQVVDLGARIKNLQATETALQGVMAKATEIKDILSVQAELTAIRGQIEAATAEKTHLETQAAFSTLTVTFSLKPNPVLTEQQGFDPATEVDRASASLVGVLQGLATAGIWFGIVWIPILLGMAIVIGIGAWVVRKVIRRFEQSSVPPSAPAPTVGESA